MLLISKYNKGTRLLLCVIDVFSKYAWVVLLKDGKGITTTKAFEKALHKSRRKPNKLWGDNGSGFYNRSMKSCLQGNDIEMHSAHKKEKSVVAERFIRTLKNKVYKYLTLISKKVHNEILDNVVNQFFAYVYTPKWSEKVFVIKKVKTLYHGHM